MRDIALNIYGSADSIDHSEGIFQAIGYKEFAKLDLNQDDPESDRAFPPMLDQTKRRTHQYAKSQIKWIRKQLLPAVREARSHGGEVEVYVVPGGAPGEAPAREVLDGACISVERDGKVLTVAFLNRKELPDWKVTGHPDAPDLLQEVYSETGVSKVPDTAE